MNPLDIDWDRLEEALFEQMTSDLERFAAVHEHETFYAFAVNCYSAEDPNCYMSLNTEEGLEQAVQDSAERGSKLSADDLRWSPGDWKYANNVGSQIGGESDSTVVASWRSAQSEFNDLTTRLFEAYEQWEAGETLDYDPEEEQVRTGGEFTDRACRSVIRMWLEEKFEVLDRTDGFKIIVSDHDDTRDECNDRYQRLWVELAPNQPSPLQLPAN